MEQNDRIVLNTNSSLENSHSLTFSEAEKTALFQENSLYPDLVCCSHLRWDFVYQRPQHLLSRAARERRVFFVEEPVWEEEPNVWLDFSRRECGVWVAVPHLPRGVSNTEELQKQLMDALFAACQIQRGTSKNSLKEMGKSAKS